MNTCKWGGSRVRLAALAGIEGRPFPQFRPDNGAQDGLLEAGSRGIPAPTPTAGRPSVLGNSQQTSTKLRPTQVFRSFGRHMLRAHIRSHTPTRQRAASRVHELPGGSLPRCLAGHDPSLDRRRPHQLLSHPRRPAPLLARPARRLHLLDAGRWPLRAENRRGRPRRLSEARRPGRLSLRGDRTSRAGGDRRTSREAGPACPPL
jgi:hypothetical protein